MPKRKADSVGQLSLENESKKLKPSEITKEVKPNLLDDSDTSSSEDESEGGAELEQSGFKINEEFAKKYEHNKKREELQRCSYNKLFAVVTKAKFSFSGGKIPEVRKISQRP